MRLFVISAGLFLGLQSLAFADITQLWSDLSTKRKALVSYHQELDLVASFSLQDHVQSSTRTVTLDGSGARWRERTVSGSGNRVSLFDGSGLFHLEADQYAREKLPRENDIPEPALYDLSSVDLKKGMLAKHVSCGLSGPDHDCLVLDLPVKPKLGNGPDAAKVTGGERRIIVDSATGLALFSQTMENRESRNQSYRAESILKVKRTSWNGTVDESQFRVPPGFAEVKDFAKWDAQRMKKELTGKPAPELAMLDINGKPIKLSSLRGKTVLLDFWTTWCGPCRADAPSLDKLFKMYGGEKLSIIGVSVNEERNAVQRFLNEHPHAYSIALTTENEMPRAYQVGVFPTYVVIDPDGNLADVSEGDSGFSKLRKMLKRAGMETN